MSDDERYERKVMGEYLEIATMESVKTLRGCDYESNLGQKSSEATSLCTLPRLAGHLANGQDQQL